MRARVTTTTKLSDLGKFGAFLFVASPLLLLLIAPTMLRADSGEFRVAAFVCLAAFLAGVLLLLTGRIMRHDVVIETSPTKQSTD